MKNNKFINKYIFLNYYFYENGFIKFKNIKTFKFI